LRLTGASFRGESMTRRLLTLLALSCMALLAAGCGSKSEYPSRPITLVVPWGAGGGTDAIARMVAGLLEKELGKPVNVVNRTGGNGVVGHQAVASAAPDGYTLGLITSEIAMMHWQGLTELTPADYTPIALINTDPAGIQVRADAPYRTLDDLLAAMRAKPGQVKATGCGQGCIWHVALAGLLGSAGLQAAAVPWVPSNGAAPGLLDLVAGGVDVVPCSLPEARSLIDAGRVRSLAVMDASRTSLFPDVPTVKEATGSDWTLAAWRGVAAPKGLPPEIAARLGAALKKAHESQEFRDFMATRGFGVVWADAAQFAAHLASADATMGETLKAIGLAAP
jgi:tripartite-type tricarboxylate transporter receptor subunit TctC